MLEKIKRGKGVNQNYTIEEIDQWEFIKVVEAKYIKNYIISLKFSDGAQGEVDFKDYLSLGIFNDLKDTEYFKSFKLGGNTVCWRNGADFAPDFLRSKI